MPNSFKELFGRKSKESVEEIELEAAVNFRNGLKEAAKQAEEQGNTGADEECERLSEEIENFQCRSEKDSKKFLNGIKKRIEKLFTRLKVSPKNRKKLTNCVDKFEESMRKVARLTLVGKIHSEHMEKVILKFFQKISEEDVRILSYVLSVDRTEIVVNKGNFISVIEKNIDIIAEYAQKHPKSSIYEWYKCLLDGIKELNKDLKSHVPELNQLYYEAKDKLKLIEKLTSLQRNFDGRICELLDLSKFIESKKFKKRSIYKANTAECKIILLKIKSKFDHFEREIYGGYSSMVDMMPVPGSVSI